LNSAGKPSSTFSGRGNSTIENGTSVGNSCSSALCSKLTHSGRVRLARFPDGARLESDPELREGDVPRVLDLATIIEIGAFDTKSPSQPPGNGRPTLQTDRGQDSCPPVFCIRRFWASIREQEGGVNEKGYKYDIDALLHQHQWFSSCELNCFIQTPVKTVKVIIGLREGCSPFKGVFFTHQKSTLQFGVSFEHTNSKVEKRGEGQWKLSTMVDCSEFCRNWKAVNFFTLLGARSQRTYRESSRELSSSHTSIFPE
jgi:hypothetical protein